VVFFIHQVLASPLACDSVHPVSTSSTQSAPVVERSTIHWGAPGARALRFGVPLAGRSSSDWDLVWRERG